MSRSADPDGKPLVALAWDLDKDGQFDDARGATVFTPAKSRTVGLAAVDASGDVGVVYGTLPRPAKLRVKPKIGKIKLAALNSRGLTVTTGCAATCSRPSS